MSFEDNNEKLTALNAKFAAEEEKNIKEALEKNALQATKEAFGANNFDEIAVDNKKRTDSFFNVRFNWLLPIYKKRAKDFYYF
jgi:hypothetical protein